MAQQPLDADLAARLGASADERVSARIAAAKQRRQQQEAIRTEFTDRRSAGLQARHAARQARLDLIHFHEQKGNSR